MSGKIVECLRCKSTMEAGYLADHGDHGSMKPAEWVEGEPEKRWWGITTKGHETVRLTAYRCPRCGYVEFRAMEAS